MPPSRNYPRPTPHHTALGLSGELPEEPHDLAERVYIPPIDEYSDPFLEQSLTFTQWQNITQQHAGLSIYPHSYPTDPASYPPLHALGNPGPASSAVAFTGFRPNRPGIQTANRFGDPSQNIIAGSETTSLRRPHRETNPHMPPTPHPIAASSAMFGTSVSDSSVTETTARAGRLPPALPNAPAPALTVSETRTILQRAQQEIYRIVTTENGVPIGPDLERYVQSAITIGKRSLAGHVDVSIPVAARRSVARTFSNVRCAFKTYCLHSINREFRLRLPLYSDGSDVIFRAQRVQELLSAQEYLRDGSDDIFFSSDFFSSYMIDMIFSQHLQLWKYVENDTLDTVFALGACAIVAALKDYQDGFYSPLDVAGSQWRTDYNRFINLLGTIRADSAQCAWLQEYQHAIMIRGHAGRYNDAS